MNKSEKVIEKLLNHFEVFTYAELAQKLNTTQPTISRWKKTNNTKSIEFACKAFGIYNQIFTSEITAFEDKQISLSSIFSQEELQKLNKTANDSGITIEKLIRLAVVRMGLI